MEATGEVAEVRQSLVPGARPGVPLPVRDRRGRRVRGRSRRRGTRLRHRPGLRRPDPDQPPVHRRPRPLPPRRRGQRPLRARRQLRRRQRRHAADPGGRRPRPRPATSCSTPARASTRTGSRSRTRTRSSTTPATPTPTSPTSASTRCSSTTSTSTPAAWYPAGHHGAVPPGSGPRHFDFHPNGRFAYAINELSNTVTVYDYDPGSGRIDAIETVSDPARPDYTGTSFTADVHVTASGRFLYGSNRGHDSLAMFAIDQGERPPRVPRHRADPGLTAAQLRHRPDRPLRPGRQPPRRQHRHLPHRPGVGKARPGRGFRSMPRPPSA